MQENPPMEIFLKRLITASKARQTAAVSSALALLDGKPEDALLYSGAQVCRMIQVSKPTLWRIVKSGGIVPIHIRGLTRYKKIDVERLAAGEVNS